MTPDQERWAEAGMVLRQRGDQAPVFVAERVATLALAGDVAGVQRWKEIAAKLLQLIDAPKA
ncbi:hypothetical protein ASG29_16110 [Sphingomonas sp. Leaf412]|uniref:DUF6961 family protein n=1 Tax=Sphingomonas sp. Leaf412 TaxID=1736370 RepID=UPI0006F9695D|nr:hypothetical protein [Sphingomonas sp. Leaf412]KQT31027.1 hypothetical protein ASG29_16110 [Sphingomonas sp. Leaf412]